ncbi:MAG: hypothetical protein COU47_03560 [Candidatus Niyogibacteria bacterium CG10_big_fil_rev_8_21_14_0_10_46_36]|uniref:Uncharacterized protein n=1 Tax=Candidatus Niyogibacteria bacterium CG10_big_fil_rev_8_21_14_0_10_46_36 TaxID=1974726 RepID=A0A2H0TCZ4_9BACT|nr:MAG: hypothetical protein COU47_03560 [Candidatus Niyogibacteria bacterium CG10_big_fil_rev_8_21_14_0_10_46_36]
MIWLERKKTKHEVCEMGNLKINMLFSIATLWFIFAVTVALVAFDIMPVPEKTLTLYASPAIAILMTTKKTAMDPMFLSAIIVGFSSGFALRDKDKRVQLMRGMQMILPAVSIATGFGIIDNIIHPSVTILPWVIFIGPVAIIVTAMYVVAEQYAGLVQEREKDYEKKSLRSTQIEIMLYQTGEALLIIAPLTSLPFLINHMT